MKHFLDILSWSQEDLWHMMKLATHLKLEWKSGGNRPVLAGKILGMVFQKPSLRTRVSFEVGMKHLGGDAIMLGPSEIGLGQRESIPDVARVLSGYVQGIMARVFDHDHVVQLAGYASVPVINGLSDMNHPCQAMADMLTIYEKFGHLEGLKLAYIGDGNNVATSLLAACSQFGMNFSAATPEGYEMSPDVLAKTSAYSQATGIDVSLSSSPQDAVQGADVVYTDTWVSMGQESEAGERLKEFQNFQVNTDLLKYASKNAIVLHCLPAHRGQEITDDVADGPQSAIFAQAENRLHAQKAILVELLA